MRLRYTEIKDRIVERLRMTEILQGGLIEGTFDLPAFTEKMVDRLILKMVRQLLREIPATEIDAFGAGATSLLSLLDGQPVPLTLIRVLTASVGGSQGEPVSEAGWFMRSITTETGGNGIWCILGGEVHAKGGQVNLQVILEPQMKDLKADTIELPEGYDLEVIDRVVKWMAFSDSMEQGRPG